MKLLGFFVLCCVAITQINGLKVLGVLPFGSKSHFAIGEAIIKTLVDAGHEATVISPFPQKKPVKRYTDVSIVEIVEKFQRGKGFPILEITAN